MKSSEFLAESDDKNPEDVKQNHPEIYAFFKEIGEWMAFDRYGQVETYNTAGNHMIAIKWKPTASHENLKMSLKDADIPFTEYAYQEGTLEGEIPNTGINFTVKTGGMRGNLGIAWRFAVPHKDNEVATPRDRTMESGEVQGGTCPHCGTDYTTDDIRGDTSCYECGKDLFEDGVANQNWFDTLAAALEAEGLSDTWDGMTMGGISYGETRKYTYDDGTRQGHFISIYRDDSGRYERPVHYARGNMKSSRRDRTIK